MEDYIKQDAVLVEAAAGAEICADNAARMLVKHHSKEGRPIIWRGVGDACTKTIACAEVMKRNYSSSGDKKFENKKKGEKCAKVNTEELSEGASTETSTATTAASFDAKPTLKPLHQVTKLSYETYDDLWTPIDEASELETIRVCRRVPVVSVLLTTEETDVKQTGYQLAYDPNDSPGPTSSKAPNPRKNYKPNAYSASNPYMKPVRSKRGKLDKTTKSGEKYREMFGGEENK